MLVVGLTGCPGAGKSVVASIFKKLGAVILSGDDIGREVVETNNEVLNALVNSFGKNILDNDGNLRRRTLGKIVFSSKTALEKLNRIVHPPLLIELKNRIDSHRDINSNEVLIVDAALIFEWGIADWFDAVVTVYADYWLRIKRIKSPGLSDAEAADRTDSQIDQKEKIRRADYTIENNGFIKDLEPEVEKIYKGLRR